MSRDEAKDRVVEAAVEPKDIGDDLELVAETLRDQLTFGGRGKRDDLWRLVLLSLAMVKVYRNLAGAAPSEQTPAPSPLRSLEGVPEGTVIWRARGEASDCLHVTAFEVGGGDDPCVRILGCKDWSFFEGFGDDWFRSEADGWAYLRARETERHAAALAAIDRAREEASRAST